MIQINDLEIMAVLTCDDVRREDNGKEILIGVYSGGAILLKNFPATISPVFWCQFKPARAGTFSVRFRLVNDSGVEFFRADGEVTATRAGEPGSVPIKGPTIQAHGETQLQLQLGVGNSELVTIQEIFVRKDMRQQR